MLLHFLGDKVVQLDITLDRKVQSAISNSKIMSAFIWCMSCGYTVETNSILMSMDYNSLTVTKIFLLYFYKENEGGLEINFFFVMSSIMPQIVSIELKLYSYSFDHLYCQYITIISVQKYFVP